MQRKIKDNDVLTDVRLWKEGFYSGRYPMYDGEMALGDLIYGGCPGVLCGRKHPTHANQARWTMRDAMWNTLISHYRARVETVIHRLKNHGWMDSTFRGSFTTLVTLNEITVVFTALEIRREIEAGKPMFEVCGPWDHAF